MSAPAHDDGLGAFLRSRRERVDPSAVGIIDMGRRRVVGLRREELAMLSGISVAYYARLEQGRDRNPSADVLDALARVLRLDDEERRYLSVLAGAPPAVARETRDEAAVRTVRPGLRHLLARWEDLPALVVNHRRDVLACTPLATRVNPAWAPASNLIEFCFLDPRARDVYADWSSVAGDAVAGLRASIAAGGSHDLEALVTELTTKSDAFRERWEQQDVRSRTMGEKRFCVPALSPAVLRLNYETFAVAGAAGQTLFVYFPEPESDDETLLGRLAEDLS